MQFWQAQDLPCTKKTNRWERGTGWFKPVYYISVIKTPTLISGHPQIVTAPLEGLDKTNAAHV